MRHSVLICDPPWHFQTRSRKGRGKSPKYPTMRLDAICALPVGDVAARDSALFLWATWPTIEQAFQLIRAWGFTYRTLAFDWIKMTRDGAAPKMGTGYYTRKCAEPCLLAVRGRMPVAARNVPDVILAATGAHSEKPEEAYRRIERLYPHERYPARLELFASANSIQKALEWGYQPLGYDVDGRGLETTLPELAAV